MEALPSTKEMNLENLSRTVDYIVKVRALIAQDTTPTRALLDSAIEQVTFTQLSFIMLKKKAL